MAAGFSIIEKNIPLFRDLLIKSFEKIFNNFSAEKNLYLDSLIAPSALNEDFYNEINLLAPFGSGNKEPTFMIENLKVLSTDIISNTHIKTLLLGMDGSTIKAYAWNGKGSVLENFLYKSKNKKINIAGNIRLNEWQGKKEVQFNIQDISEND